MMKLELKPDTLEVVKKKGPDSTCAGVSKDGQLSWNYKDGLLEVTLAQTSEVLSSWRFGKALKDFHTSITCVTDLKYHGGSLLLVATSNLTEQGMLSLYSIGLRKVIRSIEVPQKITALEVVFANANEDVPSWVLSKHLQFFSGLAAVGTEGGYVYLVDLCLDELMLHHTSETSPKKLSITTARIVDPKAKRDQARSYNKHVALLLDDQCHRQGHYYFRRQDDSVQKVLDEETVYVTSLKYMSQAGILAIGFNFGSYQLWRLYNPVLDYSSRYNPDGKSVAGFVVQEPENDPRNFVYLWVAHDEKTEDCISSICLYQLCFAKKDVYAKFGVFYNELESVCARLDHRLTIDPYSNDPKLTLGSSIISCYTITNPSYSPPATLSDSFEEGLQGNDLSLSVFVWQAEGKQGRVKHWMSIFDLNRWYHAQMPHSLRCQGNSLQVCPYWAVYSLDDIVSQTASHALLNVEIIGDKVLRFINNSPLPPEEHSYPSSLQLTSVQFIMADGSIRGRCNGWQGQLLQELISDGAQILVEPADFYYKCLRARLLPQLYEEVKTSNQSYQRIVLLNLALEHGLIYTLVSQCIQLWADGEYTEQGCTLSLLLEWAWERVIHVKHSWDTACEMLYDWSGHHLDPRTDWQLECLTESLFHLKHVFATLAAQSSPTTEKGQLELELRQDVINILLQHYNMVRWCVSFSLLPEIDEASDPVSGLFAYPVSDLCEAYRKRRTELSSLKSTVDGFNLLLIDDLLECQGPQIKKLWETLGGDGLYPPPSIQALVNMYLIEEVNIEIKYAITLYLLQDLAALSKSDTEETIVASFIQRFMLSPSLVHQVQGLWFIDHRDFEEGVRQLVNPNVHDDLGGKWKHAAVVNTLLAQAEGKAATRYLHTKGVLGGSPQEQQLYISVLMNNRHVSQAVEFMRGCQNDMNSTQLMNHLLKDCQKYKLLGQLLQLSLTDLEEKYLEDYLRQQAQPHALEPLLLYYLHHSRFLQAFQLNEDMKRLDKLETSLIAQERAATRNRLMDAYLKALPDVTRKLLMEKQRASTVASRHFQVQRPKPLSTVVHSSDHTAMSRSHFVMTVIEKVTEAQKMVMSEDEDEQTSKDPFVQKLNHSGTNVPFLSTPRTPKHRPYSRTTDTIYPELKLSPKPTNPLSTTKRKSLLDASYGQQNGNVSLRQLTEECLQLLRTPVRDHKRKSVSPGLSVKTPQSILKVRRLSKTLLPSSREKSSSRRSSGSRSKRFGFSKSDSSLLTSPTTPPVSATRTAQSTGEGVATPKQLRFVGISPSPTPSPTTVSAEFSRSPLTEVSEEVKEQKVVPEQENIQPAQGKVERNIPTEPDSTLQSVPLDTLGAPMEESPALSGQNVPARLQETLHVDTDMTELDSDGRSYKLSNKLKDLVRPDLESPWKQGVAHSENDATMSEQVVDDEITFNLTHVEEPVPTPSMTSSPVTAEADITKLREDAMEMTEQIGGSTDKDDGIHSVVRHTIEQSQEHSVSRSESHGFTFSQEIVKTTSKEVQMSVDTELSISHVRKSPRKSLSPIAKTSMLSVLPPALSPSSSLKTRSRHDDSPPATPPSSKRAKMLFSEKEDRELVRKTLLSKPSPEKVEEEEPRKRKTPERKSPSRTEQDDNKEIDTAVQKTRDSSPSRSRRRTPERQSAAKKSLKASETESSQMEARHETFLGATSQRKTPERQSAARKSLRTSESESDQVAAEDAKLQIVSNRRKTPERQATVRKSLRTSESENDEVDKEDEKHQAAVSQRKTPERQAAGRKSLKASESERDEAEIEDEKLQATVTQRKTPERQIGTRKSLRISESENGKMETGDEKPQATPASPSRRSRKSPGRTKEIDKGSMEEVFTVAEKVVEKLSEVESPTDVPVRRRSTRLNTPDRTVQDTVSLEPLSPARGRAGRGKTPQKTIQKEEKTIVIQTVTKDLESDKEEKSVPPTPKRGVRNVAESKSRSPSRKTNEKAEEKNEAEKEVSILRRSRHASKTPERLMETENVESVTPSRRSKRQPRSPEKLNTLEIEPVADRAGSTSPKRSPMPKAAMKEPGTPTRKSSTSRSPEAPLTPTRRSTRKTKILERLNTDEIEPVSPSVSPNRSPTRKNQAEAVEITQENVKTTSVPASPSRSSQRGKSEDRKTPVRGVRTRKTSHQSVQDEDITDNQSEEKSPEVKLSEKPSTRSKKSPSRQTKLPGHRSKEVIEEENKTSQEEANIDEWPEEMPPLRLDIDDEEESDRDKDSDFTKTKRVQRQQKTPDRGQKTTKTDPISEDPLPPASQAMKTKSTRRTKRKEDESRELSPSFIFSPPLKHTLRGQKRKAEAETEETENQSHVFVFSNPTIAVDKNEGEDAADNEAEKRNSAHTKTRKSKMKRALYHESPLLLSPGSPVARRSRKQATESQRASASVIKRYKPRGPRTRRIKPL